MKCKVCSNLTNNTSFAIKEMMFGTRDEFIYFECVKCGCIQIQEVPLNLGKYYPDNYYSFSGKVPSKSIKSKILDVLKRHLINYRIGERNLAGKILNLKFKNYLRWIEPGYFNYNSKILDVGCGAGDLLLEMNKLGFKNLQGIDPFLEKDINYDCGVSVYRKQLYEVSDKFDFIMLHHSFEHMDAPQDVFDYLRSLLNTNGKLLIRIPVAGSYAWRKYGVNWVELDSPRHLFIHSVQSISILAKNAKLKISKIKYDSTSFEIIGSEKYQRDISANESVELFTKQEISRFALEVERLNSTNNASRACFYFTL